MTSSNNITPRAKFILESVLENGEVSVQALADQLDVSPSTIRRELIRLEDKGLLKRTHGGAKSIEPELYESFRHLRSFNEQEKHFSDKKRRIGLAAAELIEDNDIISLTSGTTTTQVARSIRHRQNITIVTNTINVAMELSYRDDLTVFVSGGFLHSDWFSLVGPTCIRAISEYVVDKVFIGVDALHPRFGLMTHYPEQAAVNRAMINHARVKIVVTDYSKLGKIAKAKICDLDDIDILITDTDATDQDIAFLLELGIQVQRV